MTVRRPPPPGVQGRKAWRLGRRAEQAAEAWRGPRPLPPALVWLAAALFTATAATGLTLAAVQLKVGVYWVGTTLYVGILSAVLAMFQLVVTGYHRRYG